MVLPTVGYRTKIDQATFQPAQLYWISTPQPNQQIDQKPTLMEPKTLSFTRVSYLDFKVLAIIDIQQNRISET